MVQVTFDPERETKNTWRFEERLGSPLDTPRIGTVYVPKATLRELGMSEAAPITVTLEAVS